MIASAVSDARSLTDNEESIPEKSNVLERELNLTEYERKVRAANGLPSSGSANDDGNMESFASATYPKKQSSLGVEDAPKFGTESQIQQRVGSTHAPNTHSERHLARLSSPVETSGVPKITGKSGEFSTLSNNPEKSREMTITMNDKTNELDEK